MHYTRNYVIEINGKYLKLDLIDLATGEVVRGVTYYDAMDYFQKQGKIYGYTPKVALIED